MKEAGRLDGPFEYGCKPIRRNSKEDWEEVRQLAKTNQLDKISPDIYVQHYHSLTHIAKDHMVLVDAEDLRGIWIWGPTGVGKSRLARELYPNAYPKLCNKWWDGYQGQKAVIMDDIGMEHKVLG